MNPTALLREKIVSAYRYLGLAVLLGVLFVVGGYFVMVGFFLVSGSWGVPTIASPRSEKMFLYAGRYIAAKARVEELKTQYHRLKLEQATVRLKLDNKEALEDILKQYRKIGASGYQPALLGELEKERRMGILSKFDYEKELFLHKQKTAQMLGLEKLKLELGVELDLLTRFQKEALKEYDKSLSVLEASIRDFSGTVRDIETSPLFEATKRPLALVFLPYANLRNASAGDAVYSCLLHVLFCSRIGSLDRVVEGEQILKHPMFGREIRGKMVTLKVGNIDDAKADILHFSGKPFLF